MADEVESYRAYNEEMRKDAKINQEKIIALNRIFTNHIVNMGKRLRVLEDHIYKGKILPEPSGAVKVDELLDTLTFSSLKDGHLDEVLRRITKYGISER